MPCEDVFRDGSDVWIWDEGNQGSMIKYPTEAPSPERGDSKSKQMPGTLPETPRNPLQLHQLLFLSWNPVRMMQVSVTAGSFTVAFVPSRVNRPADVIVISELVRVRDVYGAGSEVTLRTGGLGPLPAAVLAPKSVAVLLEKRLSLTAGQAVVDF